MITTDSVVYLFCVLLNLSCIYTGERENVSSKCVTLHHYLAGQANNYIKIKAIVKNVYERLYQFITGQKLALQIIITQGDLGNYYYYKLNGTKARKTVGNVYLNPQQIQIILTRFTQIQALLEQKEVELNKACEEIIVDINAKKSGFEENKINITEEFESYKNLLEKHKVIQYVTKIRANEYILSLEFAAFIYKDMGVVVTDANATTLASVAAISHVSTVANEALAPGAPYTPNAAAAAEIATSLKADAIGLQQLEQQKGGISLSKFISQEKIFVGGKIEQDEAFEEDEEDEEVSYSQSLILTFTYIYLRLNGYIKAANISVLDDDEKGLIAMYYDKYVLELESDDTGDIYENMYKTVINTVNIDIDLILPYGKFISDFLYFAKDVKVETSLLQKDLNYVRNLRSHNVPIFESSTACAGRRDVYTRKTIPIGSSINVLGLCLSADTIVQLLISVAGTAQTLLDVFASVFDKIVGDNLERYRKLAPWYINPNGFLGFCNMWNSIGHTDDELVMRSKQILSIIRNILAYIYTYYREIYTALLALIPPQTGVNILGCLMRNRGDGIIVYLRNDNGAPYFGGSNKYLLKKIKSKKNRVKKVKSKKNRAKKIKSKQHRLKKIKSKKFTRKNKKSKNGVISVVMF
jgi:hypothetical protein